MQYIREIFKQAVVRMSVPAGETLTLEDCLFIEGARLSVRGAGDLEIAGCTVLYPAPSGGGGVTVMIDGSLTVEGLTIIGTGKDITTTHRFSGFTIHGASSGDVRSLRVSGFPGNGVLVEKSLPISNVAFRSVITRSCAGGMWFLDATGCSVSRLRTVDCNFKAHPSHAAGLVYPSVLDEWYEDGIFIRGDTTFEDVLTR